MILDVLLDNALKYAISNSMVSVDLVSMENCVLTVASPGGPISREDLKILFKRFYRADKARAMNGSYGLGRSIAESHMERIWAESENGYNTFLFSCQQITESKSGGLLVSPSLCCPYKLGQFTLTGGPECFYARDGTRKAVKKTCRWQVFWPWKSP